MSQKQAEMSVRGISSRRQAMRALRQDGSRMRVHQPSAFTRRVGRRLGFCVGRQRRQPEAITARGERRQDATDAPIRSRLRWIKRPRAAHNRHRVDHGVSHLPSPTIAGLLPARSISHATAFDRPRPAILPCYDGYSSSCWRIIKHR
jgi:hypothetical protein